MKDLETIILPVLEMSCAVCANNVENKVNSLSGVTSASVNFAANTITIEYDPEQIHVATNQSRSSIYRI